MNQRALRILREKPPYFKQGRAYVPLMTWTVSRKMRNQIEIGSSIGVRCVIIMYGTFDDDCVEPSSDFYG